MLKKISICLILSIALMVAFYTSTFNFSYSEPDPIKVLIDNQALDFDVAPITVDSRVLVPFRAISEALGAEVTWDEANQVVTAKKNNTTIKLTIGDRVAFINSGSVLLDVPPQIIDNRTLIPIRFISESFGAKVDWDGSTRTVSITPKKEAPKISYKGISLGSSLEKVSELFGDHKRIDDSEYGFQWYIFHEDYKNYVQFGIKSDKVVAIYSNSDGWDNKHLSIGTDKDIINGYLKDPIDRILKGNVIFLLNKDEGSTVYRVDNGYLTVFFDIHNSSKVTSLLLIDKVTEENFQPNKPYTDELRKSYELQAFDLANSIRVREGLSVLTWSDKAAVAAYKHSEDMATSHFFDHNNLRGEDPFARMRKEGINYSTAGENLAAGQQNAIYAHEGWLNSKGHRDILFGDFERLGVGVAFGGPYKVYYTQNYYTAR